MFYFLVLQWVAFITLTINFLKFDGYLHEQLDLKYLLLLFQFWMLVLSLIIFSFWRNKKTIYQSLKNTIPNLFYSIILGAIILILPAEAHFFVFVGLAFWMFYARNTENSDKKKYAFILVNLICFYLIIFGMTLSNIVDIGGCIIVFFVLIFYMIATYKMYPNKTIAKYNISAVFLSFLVFSLPGIYSVIFNQSPQAYPVYTVDVFSILLIIPTLILTYGYFRKSAGTNSVTLTKTGTVLIWLLTFGIPIIGIIIFIVMEGLSGLGS
ncbi:MAG: hypothetical protein N2C11_06735 [Planococcus sp. (in: firmicutes)]